MKEYKKTVPVVQLMDITRETLSDVLSLIHEGGISYWGDLDCDNPTYYAAKDRLLADPEVKDDSICYEDVLAEVLIEDGVLTIYDREEEDRPHDFTLSDLEEAIAYAAAWYGLDMTNWDGLTGDYIGQMICFGEVIYG